MAGGSIIPAVTGRPRELFRGLIRLLDVGKITEAPLRQRRALNQAIICASHVPPQAVQEARVLVRSLRSALRMSQAQLARRCGVPRAHIARLEAGLIDFRLATLARLFDAMFCDLVILPKARKRPGDAIADARLERRGYHWRIWDEPRPIGSS